MKAKKIVGICSIVMALIGGFGGVLEKNSESIAPACIFFVLGIILLLPKSKKKKEREQKQNQEKEAMALQIERLGIKKKAIMEHMCGLDIPEGAMCEVCLCNDKYAFIRNNSEYALSFSKVIDVSIKTEMEIQNNYVSSIGGAVGGAALLGPLGAMIGGRTKKKTDTIIHHYITFAYKKGDTHEFISFDCTYAMDIAILCKNEFDKQEKEINSIEL